MPAPPGGPDACILRPCSSFVNRLAPPRRGHLLSRRVRVAEPHRDTGYSVQRLRSAAKPGDDNCLAGGWLRSSMKTTARRLPRAFERSAGDR